MTSKFYQEYQTLMAQTAGLDPVEDRSTLRQLIAAKSEILSAWRAAVGNTYAFKAEVQQCQLDMNKADLTKEQIEGAKVDIELLKRASKGERLMPEDRDAVLAQVRKEAR